MRRLIYYFAALTISMSIPAGAIAQIDSNLCDTDATQPAQDLYKYLKDEVWGKKVLSGCQALWNYNTTEAEKINSYCGKYPKVNIFDFQHYMDSHNGANWIDYSGPTAKEWQDNGGIVGFMWHWNVPVNCFAENKTEWYAFYAQGGGSPFTYFSADRASTQGTIENRIINRELDIIAEYLLQYQQDGMAILWRPLHEAAGNTNSYSGGKAWFWWGADGKDAFIRLYRYMFDYLRGKGVHNLIYMWTSQMNDADWYPGDEYVDIVARDNYEDSDHGSLKKDFTTLKNRYPNKMIALPECKYVPSAENMEADGATWLLVAPWCSDEYVPGYNDETFWQTFMNQDNIITR